MNQIRAIQALNKKEIENGISPEASWHTDYRDTAFINFGGLPYDMTEGDVITVFSQYGEPVWLKLVRDKETGKSKGFGWLKYEDQRSCDLAVDNLGGATIGSRLVRVDHARYKFHDDEDPDEGKVDWETMRKRERGADNQADEEEDEGEEEDVNRRPMLPEERELALIIRDHDEDDPMKQFLIDEKKKEVEDAVKRYERSERRKRDKERHRHGHRSHRSRRDDRDEDMKDADDRDRGHRSRRDRDGTPTSRHAERDSRSERRHPDSHTRESYRDRDERRRDRSEDRRDRRPDSGDESRRERRHHHERRREKSDRGEDRRRRRRDDDRHGDSRQRSRSRSRSRSASPRPTS